MQLQEASRHHLKIKIGIQGASSTGKTMSALLIAYGLCKDWNKIAVIDTEKAAALYAHLGNYKILPLTAPFTPESLITAIDLCVQQQIAVIILDSISQLWAGSGGILDIHAATTGNNTYTNWLKVMPRYNALVEKLLQTDIHIITTIRTKPHYELMEKNGKQIPVKNGFKPICHHALPYEFSLLLTMNQQHQATTTKDRTGLLGNTGTFVPNEQTGNTIAQWCNEDLTGHIHQRINACKSVEELIDLYTQSPAYQDLYAQHFTNKKDQLQATTRTT